ncbi:hypothetical protein XM82_004666 [Salmonella enterica subsp. enterica serovar Haifa]|uniref:hypothetical protein n=1 Tax=Microbacterium sp. p3-SID336 TaxID=2916212 RepID=UPI001DE52D81|nr:hypothetical protein [Microbacterium sp. p3-SID336]EEB9150688.1 hypothetical protein [Salmonella enterica subsp. enterica serovar Paratyphi B]EED6225601.1 hypothetical protein [Salmonella enterica subsp. enterica serovar Haifa]MCT1479856.1 hypothetical protein [Microbacterium sp. p3-SID336]
MQTFTVVCIATGIAILLAGAIMLLTRTRLLAFVRARYAAVLSEDRLSAQDVARRMPRMRAIIVIATGFLLFGGALLTLGLFRALA